MVGQVFFTQIDLFHQMNLQILELVTSINWKKHLIPILE